MTYSKAQLAEHFLALGVREGDVVLMRAAVRAVGPVAERPAETLVDAALAAVGPSGTLISLAFSKNVFRFRRTNSVPFTRETPVTTGGFAAAMLSRPDALRSAHPTSSFVAIGHRASEVLAGHGPSQQCFAPIDQLLSMDGKMVLVGCVESSPGFSTVHRAQETLGLANMTLIGGLFGAYYEEGGEKKWFSRRDVSGCSMGFGKFYAHYVAAEKLRTGFIGNAYSALIGARDAYAIEHAVLQQNPRFALCSRPDCVSCRGTRLYNLRDVPMFALRTIISPSRVLNKIT